MRSKIRGSGGDPSEAIEISDLGGGERIPARQLRSEIRGQWCERSKFSSIFAHNKVLSLSTAKMTPGFNPPGLADAVFAPEP